MSKQINLPIGETRLDPIATREIFDMYNRDLPNTRAARSAFFALVFCEPPMVQLPRMQAVMSDELAVLLQRFHLDFYIERYNYMKMFGICPYYLYKLRGYEHRVPRIPAFGAGFITTFFDSKTRVQNFRWYWTTGTTGATFEHDAKMMWSIGRNPPTLDGKYTSDMATLLTEYRSTREHRRAYDICNYQQSHPPIVIEHHPARNEGPETALTTLQAFGPNIAGQVIEGAESLRAKRYTVRTDELKAQMHKTFMANRGLQISRAASLPYANHESVSKMHEVSNYGFEDRMIILRPDFRVVNVAKPTLVAPLADQLRRLDVAAAALMDFPIEMINGTTSTKAANIDGAMRFITERTKEVIRESERFATDVILRIYGKALQKGLDNYIDNIKESTPEPWRVMRVYVENEITVTFPCTPMVKVQDVLTLLDRGMIDKETAAKRVFSILGLPIDEISISEEEPPQQPQKKPVARRAAAAQPPRKQRTDNGRKPTEAKEAIR